MGNKSGLCLASIGVQTQNKTTTERKTEILSDQGTSHSLHTKAQPPLHRTQKAATLHFCKLLHYRRKQLSCVCVGGGTREINVVGLLVEAVRPEAFTRHAPAVLHSTESKPKPYTRQVLRNDDNFKLPKFIHVAGGGRIYLAVNTKKNEFGENVGRWLKPDASHASIIGPLKKVAARFTALEQVGLVWH